MKTALIISEYHIQQHAGEEYDAIIYVTDYPDTMNIDGEASRIISELEQFGKEEEVTVYLAAPPVYYTIAENVIGKCKSDGYKVNGSWFKN